MRSRAAGDPQPRGHGMDRPLHHTWELSALRAWGVTFLAVVCASQVSPPWLPDPTVLFTVAGLAGIAVSITGHRRLDHRQ